MTEPALPRDMRRTKIGMFASMGRAGGGLFTALILSMLISGCGMKPTMSRPAPRPLDIRLDYSSGSTLSGPGPIDINNLRIEEACHLSLQIFALEEVPPQALESIQKHIRLVMISPHPNFLAPIMRLTPGARVALSEDDETLLETMVSGAWGPVVPAGHLKGVLPPNVTGMVDLESSKSTSIRGHHLRMLVARRRDPDPNHPGTHVEHLEIALVRTGRVPAADELRVGMPTLEETGEQALETVTQRVALLPLPLTLPHRSLLLIPFGWESEWAGAMALSIKLEQNTDNGTAPERMEAFAQCVEALMRQAEHTRSIHGSDPRWSGCLLALEQLVWRLHWRRALVDLTHTTNSPLAGDIALGASAEVARRLARGVYAAHVETPAKNLTELSWLMEKTAYWLLLDLSETDELTPALLTYLLRHTGQLGRQRSTLREQLAEAKNQAGLERRLIRENIISLEDMSPAARSRAYDWLRGKGRAPADYDPLASMQERRAALQAALEAKGTAGD